MKKSFLIFAILIFAIIFLFNLSLVSASYCGDDVCDANENQWSCWQDCAEESYCGDGICNSDENQWSCPSDCAVPIPGANCLGGSSYCIGKKRGQLLDSCWTGYAHLQDMCSDYCAFIDSNVCCDSAWYGKCAGKPAGKELDACTNNMREKCSNDCAWSQSKCDATCPSYSGDIECDKKRYGESCGSSKECSATCKCELAIPKREPAPEPCSPGTKITQSCGESNVGVCKLGTQTRTCKSNGLWGEWGDCIGAIYSSTEVCDGKDNDCDAVIDENCVQCVDNDNDGYYLNCAPLDCNDNNAAVKPGAAEICDGKDNDCDTVIDENCVQCVDNDNDGYYLNCAPLDCNDNNAAVKPGAAEICDGKDNNCNNLVDEGNVCYVPQPQPTPEEEIEYSVYLKIIPVSDFISIGNDAVFFISLKNTGEEDLKDLKIIGTIFDLDVKKTIGPFNLNKGDTVNKLLYIQIPDDAEKGEYYLRLTIANDFMHRIKHRVLIIK